MISRGEFTTRPLHVMDTSQKCIPRKSTVEGAVSNRIAKELDDVNTFLTNFLATETSAGGYISLLGPIVHFIYYYDGRRPKYLLLECLYECADGWYIA